MYKSDQKQLKFEIFYLPFGGKLRSDNRWVKLAKLIPWDEFEELYTKSLAGTGMGTPAMSVRVALGALIIKERLGTADEETVEQIREKARRQFLAVAKQKQLSHRKRRQAMRQQLGYLSRNLKSIARLNNQCSLSLLSRRQYKNLLVIEEVHRQQRSMFVNQTNRVDDRIVSIFQPHVRPIKRGKPGAATEFGAKISMSLVNGYSFVDRLSWDSYNESGDLKSQIRKYLPRFGCWPESVHADKIYRTRNNRKFCKKHGIRLSGPALDRPPKQAEKNREIRKQIYQDEVARNGIEGKFGQGKRRFGLDRVMSKLAITSESAILVTFLVMNLERWLKAIIFWLFYHWAILVSDRCHIQAETLN